MPAGGASQTQVQSQLQSQLQPHGTMQGYDPGAFFCEMLRPGQPQHPTLTLLLSRLAALPIDSLRQRAADAERDLLERGITFTVYSDATAIDRILPFDLIPRVITPAEWHADRNRRDPARARAEHVPARHLPRPEDPRRRDRAGRTGAEKRRLLRGDGRLRRAVQHLCPCLRHRHRARRDRRLPGAGGQRPHPLRRRLCGRKPPHEPAGDVRPDDQPAGARRR